MFVLIDTGGTIVYELARRLSQRDYVVRVVQTMFSKPVVCNDENIELVNAPAFDARAIAAYLMGAKVVVVSAPTSPKIHALREVQERVVRSLRSACEIAEVQSILHVSKFGAHLGHGTGPILGAYLMEQALNSLTNCRVKHIRAAYFLENFYRAIPVLKSFGVMSGLLYPHMPFFYSSIETFVDVIVRELNGKWEGDERSTLHVREANILRPHDLCERIGEMLGIGTIEYVRSDIPVAQVLMQAVGISMCAAMEIIGMYESFYTATFVTEILKGPTEVFPSTVDRFVSSFAAKYSEAN